MKTMDFTMITPYHNHDNDYISLILNDFVDLPNEVTVNGKNLRRKSEFHVSLMALKHILPFINADDVGVTENNLVQDFLDYQRSALLTEFILTGELRYVQRDERKTIVAMVSAPKIEDLFEQLREKYEAKIPTQPTHITLYTLQPEAGIGLFSQKELTRDSKEIFLPELASILM